MSDSLNDGFANFLQAVGFHAVHVWPFLPMYLHIMVSAIFPIYTGAHASLMRPSSAAKPQKKKKHKDSEADDDESEQKLEGLSATDIIVFPVMAGTSLAGLYYLIKILEDPALLNKILNWYFSIFGTLATGRLLTDAIKVATSIVFPKTYYLNGHIWEIRASEREARSLSDSKLSAKSPLPSYLARLPLPSGLASGLWTARASLYKKLHSKLYIHKILRANVRIHLADIIGLALAISCELYFNLVSKPWWLTNILGFSFAYSSLQYVSPSSASIGSLILVALFFYDIYFVFFTPMMVTVATKLDIPAKLLFPRPRHPEEPPDARPMSMLGLGDIVLPGIVIAFALRFDLYLFYLRQQKGRTTHQDGPTKQGTEKANGSAVTKAKWVPATGGWGERLWTSTKSVRMRHGGQFPKTYFHATIAGYLCGLWLTLLIMLVFEHAQPALLYLVPCVVGSLWLTAIWKGDLKILWAFNEMDEDEEDTKDKGKALQQKTSDQSISDWVSQSFIGKMARRLEGKDEKKQQAVKTDTNKTEKAEKADGNSAPADSIAKSETKARSVPWDGKLVSFTITLPMSDGQEADERSKAELKQDT